MDLKEQIEKAIEEKITGTDYFLVEVKASPAKVAVFIDSSDKGGIKLDDCVGMTKYLREKFEDSGLLETHELEVSSPGMDAPLKVLKQYVKRINQQVTVLLKNGIRKDGILLSADEKGIEISNGNTMAILFEEIKETRIIYSFNKVIN